MSTSLIRGAYGHRISQTFRHCTKHPNRSHKDLITLAEGKVLVREENSTSILSGQCDDIVLEHVERETLSEGSLEV